jgi:hypothetical protein
MSRDKPAQPSNRSCSSTWTRPGALRAGWSRRAGRRRGCPAESVRQRVARLRLALGREQRADGSWRSCATPASTSCVTSAAAIVEERLRRRAHGPRRPRSWPEAALERASEVALDPRRDRAPAARPKEVVVAARPRGLLPRDRRDRGVARGAPSCRACSSRATRWRTRRARSVRRSRHELRHCLRLLDARLDGELRTPPPQPNCDCARIGRLRRPPPPPPPPRVRGRPAARSAWSWASMLRLARDPRRTNAAPRPSRSRIRMPWHLGAPRRRLRAEPGSQALRTGAWAAAKPSASMATVLILKARGPRPRGVDPIAAGSAERPRRVRCAPARRNGAAPRPGGPPRSGTRLKPWFQGRCGASPLPSPTCPPRGS